MEAASELNPAPSKRLKTLDKGKEKMEEPELTASGEVSPTAAGMDEEEETCGICLSDSGRSIRGRIDSCDHYFCFVCILEWAKIESRCPLCKRRFQSIRRPPVRDVFLVERVVDVPVRDQVNHPLGNESTSLSDPYAHVGCSICHNSRNEELLLLCDLCDSAAHTYCVGLGATVPEGDWYCSDCTISRDRHSKSQLDNDSLLQDSCKDDGVLQVPEQLTSISDIVYDEIPFTSSRKSSNPSVLRTKRTCQRSQSRNISRGRTQDSGIKAQKSSFIHTVGEPLGNSENNIETGARTLRNCRNLHGRIQSLRANWNCIRAGSLHFSSNVSSAPTGTSSSTAKQQESTSHVKQEQATSSNISSKTNKMTDSSDIDKAWEMLKIAKAAQETKRDSKSDDFPNSPGKRNALKNAAGYPTKSNVHNVAEKLQPFSNACKGKLPVGNRACSTRPEDQYFTFNMNQRCNTLRILRQTPDADKRTEVQNFQGPNWKGTLSARPFLCQTPQSPGFVESLDDPHPAACPQNGVSIPPSKKLSNICPSDVEANSKVGIVSQINTSLTLSNKGKRNFSDKSESLDNQTGVQNFEGPKWKGALRSQTLLCQTPHLPGFQESLDDPGSASCSQNVVLTPPSKKLSNITPSNVKANTKVGIGSHINASLTSGDNKAKRNLSDNSESLDKQSEVQNFQGPNWKDALPSQTPRLPGLRESLDDPGSAACSKNGVSTPSKKLSDISFSDVEANSKVGIGSQINTSLTLRNNEAKRNLSDKLESLDKLNLKLPGSHVCGNSMKTSGSSNNSPKGEIQSLVKLNLKLLNKDKQLEAATFKEIARTATHTILAACGLEHSKSSARSFPTSICSHSDQIKQLRKSNLLPDSCRECFYTFVQTVVSSVLSEKKIVQT